MSPKAKLRAASNTASLTSQLASLAKDAGDRKSAASSSAGSGFAAARQQLSAAAKGSAKQSFDSDLALQPMAPPALAEALRPLADQVALTLAPSLEAALTADEQLEPASEVLRLLFVGATAISASLLRRARLPEGVYVLRVDIAAAGADGQSDEPCVVKLGGAAALKAEAARAATLAAALIGGESAACTPLAVVAGPTSDASKALAGMRCELPGGCWRLPEYSSRSTLGKPEVLGTFADQVAAFVDGSGAGASGAEAPAAIEVVWAPCGPLDRIGGGGKAEVLECRGDGGWAARALSAICYELCSQLLPGLKDGRRRAVEADVPASLVKELSRLIGLKEVRSPDGKGKVEWGARPGWFDESPLCDLATDAEECAPLVSLLKTLGQLAASSPTGKTASEEVGAPLSWTAKWRPRARRCHGDLRARALLVDARRCVWLASGGGDEVGGGGLSRGLFDDAAQLLVSILVESTGDDDDQDGAFDELRAAADAVIVASRPCWLPRDAPVGASPSLRRAVKLCSAVLLSATRHAVTCGGAKEPADLHPSNWLLPLTTHALRLLRLPEVPEPRRRLAWRVALRAAAAAHAALLLPPEPVEGIEAWGAVLTSLRADNPVLDTRLNLACCQPLTLKADLSAGETASRIMYIDTEGALATTTGGRWTQQFDDILCSFKVDDLATVHLAGHVRPTAFDDVSEYDQAFTAVAGHFALINPKLLKLKPRLGELAPLLFSSASTKAEQLSASIVAELVEALKGEKEEDVAAACQQFRAAVADTKAWCASRSGAKGGVTPKVKLEAAEKLAIAMAAVAHELAVCKSQQGETLSDRCRVPRFDRGQRITCLDRAAHPPAWRDATVLHGGPVLVEIDGDGKVLRWGERAEELTGRGMPEARGCADWVEALLSGSEDMLDYAREVGAKVLAGLDVETGEAKERGLCSFESVCMPLAVKGLKPMCIAPCLIRPTGGSEQSDGLPTGCKVESAAALIVEAGTDLHLVAFDGGAGSPSRLVEMCLEPLNHAPLSLGAAAFDEQLARHACELQMEHASMVDPLGRRVGAAPLSLAALAGGGDDSDGSISWERFAGDAKGLCEKMNVAYKANVHNADCAGRLAIAALITAGPASGKSTFVDQLAVHAAAALRAASAGPFALVPLVIRALELGRLMRLHPASFGSAWNYVEAYLALTHGAGSPRHACLRQCLLCRRCLIIIDGLDEGGATSDGDGKNLPPITTHVLEELVNQGHPLVVTARPDSFSELLGEKTDGGDGGSSAVLRTAGVWGRLTIAPLDDEQQRAMVKARFFAEASACSAVHSFIDSALKPVDRSLPSSPFVLSALVAVFQLAGTSGERQRLPTTLGEFLDATVDCMLSRVDRIDRAAPANTGLLAGQRTVLEVLALLAHARGGRSVAEEELLAQLEGKAELQASWARMRRKLARGALPLLRVLSAKPLVVCVSHVCLQEYLAALALCHGRWLPAMPKPWAWSSWWRGVARFGHGAALQAHFGAALLAACKTQDVVLDHVSGDPPTVADALLAMSAQASANGSRVRLKAGGKADVIREAQKPDQHGPCPAGVLRCPEFGLSSLPSAGLAVCVSLMAAEPSINELHLAKNGLAAQHATALIESVSRGLARLNVERNELGTEGAVGICEALVRRGGESALVDLDLAHNGIGIGAAASVASLLQKGSLQRLVLTSNPLCGGVQPLQPGEEAPQPADGEEAPPPNLPSAKEVAEAVKALASALGANTTLAELQLRAVGLEHAAGAPLGEALGVNRTLTHLSLWKNKLGGEGGKALIEKMKFNVGLLTLDLRTNSLDDSAGAAIAAHLQNARSSRISTLLLSDNLLGPDSGKALAKAWTSADALSHLDIRANKLVGVEGMATVKELKAARGAAARKRAGKDDAPPVELLIDEV